MSNSHRGCEFDVLELGTCIDRYLEFLFDDPTLLYDGCKLKTKNVLLPV